MMQLDSQFYDQLQQRLNRQDEALERIEQGQTSLLSCMSDHKIKLASHLESDTSNFKWITWIMGGVWAALAGIGAFLIKH